MRSLLTPDGSTSHDVEGGPSLTPITLNLDTDDMENSNTNCSELRLEKKDEIREIILASPSKSGELYPILT